MKKILEMTWATHEALRRLGFISDDIYVAVRNVNEAFVILKKGDKQFNIRVGLVENEQKYYDEWTKFATDIIENRVSDEELEGFWNAWLSKNSGLDLILALKDNGFSINDNDLN
jgi:hypothetical protein